MTPIHAFVLFLSLHAAAPDDWPQWRGPRRDGVWREDGVLHELPEGQLPLRWKAPIGAGYSGPTVAEGRVFVSDRIEEPEGRERVHAFAADTGEKLWTHEYACSYEGLSYPAGPRCAVLVHEGLAVALGAVGHLRVLDAKSGELRWARDLGTEYDARMPVWGIAASPLVEQGLLIVPASGGEGACVVAFDLRTGEEAWTALADRGNYSAPIVVDQARKRVLVLWTGDRVVGLAPESGELYWSHAFAEPRNPLGVATPVLAGDKLFLTGFYDGCVLLQLAQDELAVKQLWRRQGTNERNTDGLHSIISTPLILGEHIYGVDSYGELRCLSLADGARVWEDQSAVPKARWATIHFVQQGERTWMLNERGELLIGKLGPAGFEELSRAKLLDPTLEQLNQRGGVVWSHPAFANKHVFARNDRELVCADLSAR